MLAYRVWLLSATCLALAFQAAPFGLRTRRLGQAQDLAVVRVAALAAGSIYGAVLDESGAPIDGAVVSALGGATAFAVTDRAGQYRLTELPPGPYVVRAHRDGFAGTRSTLVNVRPASTRAVVVHPEARRRRRRRVLAPAWLRPTRPTARCATRVRMAWRLRRLTRSVLKDEHGLGRLRPADDDWFLEDSLRFLGRAVESSARLATSAFSDWPLYGQVNLLTATAYDDSGEFVDFGPASGRGVLLRWAPPWGRYADWSARAAMNSGDVTSWTMAGDYVTRAPAAPSHQRSA